MSHYQLCPKCDGEAMIPEHGPSSLSMRACPVCKGARVLLVPDGTPSGWEPIPLYAGSSGTCVVSDTNSGSMTFAGEFRRRYW